MKKILLVLCTVIMCSGLSAADIYLDSSSLVISFKADNMVQGNSLDFNIDVKQNKLSIASSSIPSTANELTFYCQKGDGNVWSFKFTKDGSSYSVKNKDYTDLASILRSDALLMIIVKDNDNIIIKATVKLDSKELTEQMELARTSSIAEYEVGDTGPAGGIIVVVMPDNSLGFRYIEATPADVRIVNGKPSCDSMDMWYDFADQTYVFGLYRTSDNSDNLFVNGAPFVNWGFNKTSASIGEGWYNTLMLVSAMEDSAYEKESGNSKVSNYAAKMCYDLEYNGFDDWCLPSKDELDAMYSILNSGGYWNSTEDSTTRVYSYKNRSSHYRVRAIRYFSDDASYKQQDVYLAQTVLPTCGEMGYKEYKYVESNIPALITPLFPTGQHKYKNGYCEECGLANIGTAKGPAGGFVFYDCDADNYTGNKDGLNSKICRWRYLEAAPSDLEGTYAWGNNGSIGTKTEIGAGKENTSKISATRNGYTTAAKACLDYSVNGYDDWFLPSKDELDLMYNNLEKNGLGSFAFERYLSSSEYSRNADYAWNQDFSNGNHYNYSRNYYGRVRAVRAF